MLHCEYFGESGLFDLLWQDPDEPEPIGELFIIIESDPERALLIVVELINFLMGSHLVPDDLAIEEYRDESSIRTTPPDRLS